MLKERMKEQLIAKTLELIALTLSKCFEMFEDPSSFLYEKVTNPMCWLSNLVAVAQTVSWIYGV